MGYEHNGFAQPFLQRQELALQLIPREWIERAEWLVHEQNLWIRRKRPRHADSLFLSPRKLMRIARGHFRSEPDHLHQLHNAGTNSVFRPPLNSGDETDIALYGEVRKQADILNHVADVAAQANDIALGSRNVFDSDFATGGQQKAVD